MFGYDSIIVIPILLLLAVVGAFLAVALIVYSEAVSISCKVCGVEFMGNRDLKSHMKDHEMGTGTKKPVSKGRGWGVDKAE